MLGKPNVFRCACMHTVADLCNEGQTFQRENTAGRRRIAVRFQYSYRGDHPPPGHSSTRPAAAAAVFALASSTAAGSDALASGLQDSLS